MCCRRSPTLPDRLRHLLFWLLLASTLSHQLARAQPFPADPSGFFTNLSSRLLTADLGTSLAEIQIAPTNHYTAAVHRWLQVTANLWASTAADPDGLPTVFQPQFRYTNQAVYLAGHVLVTNASQLEPLPIYDLRLLTNPATQLPANGNFLCYQVPLVLSARPHLPAFNEFATESVFQIKRLLQVRRDTAFGPITQTNQAFHLQLHIPWGVEFWQASSKISPARSGSKPLILSPFT